MSAIFHTLSRASADSLDMNNKTAFGLHHASSFSGNIVGGGGGGGGGGGRGGSGGPGYMSPVVTPSYRTVASNNQDPMRRQMSTVSRASIRATPLNVMWIINFRQYFWWEPVDRFTCFGYTIQCVWMRLLVEISAGNSTGSAVVECAGKVKSMSDTGFKIEVLHIRSCNVSGMQHQRFCKLCLLIWFEALIVYVVEWIDAVPKQVLFFDAKMALFLSLLKFW